MVFVFFSFWFSYRQLCFLTPEDPDHLCDWICSSGGAHSPPECLAPRLGPYLGTTLVTHAPASCLQRVQLHGFYLHAARGFWQPWALQCKYHGTLMAAAAAAPLLRALCYSDQVNCSLWVSRVFLLFLSMAHCSHYHCCCYSLPTFLFLGGLETKNIKSIVCYDFRGRALRITSGGRGVGLIWKAGESRAGPMTF